MWIVRFIFGVILFIGGIVLILFLGFILLVIGGLVFLSYDWLKVWSWFKYS